MFSMYIDGNFIEFSEIRDLNVEVLEDRKYGVTFNYSKGKGFFGTFDRYADAYEIKEAIAKLVALEGK